MVSVDGDRLVGLVVRVVREHLRTENTLSTEPQTPPESAKKTQSHGSLTGFLLVSSRVSFHALTRTGTGVRTDGRGARRGSEGRENLHGVVLAVGAQVDR